MGAERPSHTRGALKTRGGCRASIAHAWSPKTGDGCRASIAHAWSRRVDASTAPYFFLLFFLEKSRKLSKFVSVLLSASVKRFDVSRMRYFFLINHATSPKLYRSYYPHRSRDSLSPVCGIFIRKNSDVNTGDLKILHKKMSK